MVSTSLEMTGRNTITRGWRRGEGAPPYRDGKRHIKRAFARRVIPAGGRGRPPLLRSIESKYRHRRLARRGSLLAPARFLDCARNDGAKYHYARLAAGRGRPALPRRNTTFQTKTCQRRLAVGRTRRPPLPPSTKVSANSVNIKPRVHPPYLRHLDRSERRKP